MDQEWENPNIAVAELPSMANAAFQNHPIRYRKLRLLGVVVLFVFPLIGWGFMAYFAPMIPTAIVGGILLILISLTLISIFKGYKRRSYALREKDLTYRKGWLFQSTTTIPFNRIQHTEVSHGPIERKFALCTLKIFTAGGSTSDLSVPGLEIDEAKVLRDFIAHKAGSHV